MGYPGYCRLERNPRAGKLRFCTDPSFDTVTKAKNSIHIVEQHMTDADAPCILVFVFFDLTNFTSLENVAYL